MIPNPTIRPMASAALALGLFSAPAPADMTHEWITRLPVGAALSAGIQGMVVDAAGVTYVTGNTGPSGNTDVLTAAIAPDGTLLWSRVFNGPEDWHDQARGIALGPGGVVYVAGNTPGPGLYANVLLLKYEAVSGTLLDSVQYSSGPFTSEHGQSVATDALGGVYLAGGTVGDGADAMVLKFDASGVFEWKRVWDGPASAPYSQDHGRIVRVAPDGNPVVMIHGVMSSLHPDYVVVKYAATDGATMWEATWGVSGEDSPTDMELDAAGDVYVTGTGIQLTNKFSTIKLRGSDGQLVWQEYDSHDFRDHARALGLDGQGGVYITGSVDPDGDQSNQNDNFYTVKRDAATGAQRWTHLYGLNCIGCLDLPADVLAGPAGHVFVAGSTSSAPYSADMITFVLDASSGAELKRGVVSAMAPELVGASVLRFDPAHDLLIGGQGLNADTGAVEITVVKYGSLAYAAASFCDTSPDSTGSGAIIGASGSASVAANDFTLLVHGAAASEFGLFFYGTEQVRLPFGDGLRCVGGAVFRLHPPQTTDGLGFASRRVDFTQPPAASGPGAIAAGSLWNFQFWFRDPAAGGAGFNLSDGLAAIFLP